MNRPDWNRYFMGIAEVVASRATCPRKQVGAVIVDPDFRIISTGYNGAPSGLPHCSEVGCALADIDGKASCIRVLHAESNAIDQVGDVVSGCRMYVTVVPCYECAKRIANARISDVFYREWYDSKNTALTERLFSDADIGLIMLS